MPPENMTQKFAHIALPVPIQGGFDYIIPDHWDPTALKPGTRVLAPFGNRKLIGFVLELRDKSDIEASKLKALAEHYGEPPAFSPTMLKLLVWASSYYMTPLGEVFSNALPKAYKKASSLPEYQNTTWHRTEKPFAGRSNAHKQIAALAEIEAAEGGIRQDALRILGFSSSLIKTLEKDDYIRNTKHDRLSKAMQINETPNSYHLTEEQTKAANAIKTALGNFTVTLLEGITGSGKTEVYISAVKDCLAREQQVLVLVPEINLTPQTFSRFQSQLGLPIALYHSNMSDKEKFISHQLMQKGQAQVLIGTRSAIFTPCENLGLIIIDEEHDNSYKQSDGFKYSARDLGIKRAQLANCPIVLGSATPSSDTYANVQSGRYQHLMLHQRSTSAGLPTIHAIDMRASKGSDIFHPRTLHAIKAELDSGNQAIIFQNRRGLAPSLMCFDCGWLCPCPNCDTRITVHQRPPRLHCHHCDHQSQLPQQCPQCNGTNLNAVGAGTEKLEQILRYNFPLAELVRMDRDEVKSQTDLVEIISKIKTGEPCLIVGTQMVSKGHDFPNVTLVVIVDADGLFFSSDFRAMEKGAQQLIQVAGRAGRGDKEGRVLIQTRHPDHPLFATLKKHDYSGFISDELRERELCALPPYSKLMTIRAESPSASDNEAALSALKAYLTQTTEAPEMFAAGPLAASIMRKQNRYRHLLNLFCKDARQRHAIQQHLIRYLEQFQTKSVKLKIDIDPLEVT